MIDIDKKYRTRDGREVHIYATDCDNSGSVHGAIKGATGWNPGTWMRDGSWSNFEGALDLIEVKPRMGHIADAGKKVAHNDAAT